MQIESYLAQAKAPRKIWWLALAILIGSAFLGVWIHSSGLSRWLGKVSIWHTLSGIFVFLVGLAFFLAVSKARTNDLNSSGRLWWLLLLLPIWAAVMGLVPSAKGDDQPVGTIINGLLKWIAIAGVAATAVGGGYLWLTSSSLPSLGSRSMAFFECKRFLSSETTRTQAQRTTIVDTQIMMLIRLRKDGKSVLLTCSRPDGKLIVTEGID